MGAVHRYFSWEFNSKGWSDAVKKMVLDHGIDYVCEAMSLDKSTVDNWSKGRMGATPFPRMTNFLKFCDHFDFDPRLFFQLEEK